MNSLNPLSKDVLPSGWTVTALKHICRKITDGSHFSPSKTTFGKKYVTVSNVFDDQIHLDEADFISEDAFNELVKNGCQPQPSDVLLSKDGSVGRTAVVYENDFVVLSSLAIITPITKLIRPTYLKYFLDSKPCQEQMNLAMAGTALRRITLAKIVSLQIVVPPAEIQGTIVNYLNKKCLTIDSLIGKYQKELQVLVEYRQSLITRAVTKGLDPNVEMKDSGVEWIGAIPKNWKLVPLKLITSKIGSGKTPLGGATVYQEQGIKIIRSQNVYGGSIHFDEAKCISDDIAEDMLWCSLQENDVLINITGASIGRSGVVPKNAPESVVNQHVCIIRLLGNQMRPKFLSWYLNSVSGQEQIKFVQNGASREALTFEQLGNFLIPCPSFQEQDEIIAQFQVLNKHLNVLSENIQKVLTLLAEYRSSLISAAVTGKLAIDEEATA